MMLSREEAKMERKKEKATKNDSVNGRNTGKWE